MPVRGYFGGRLRRRYTAEIVSTRLWERRFALGDPGIAPPAPPARTNLLGQISGTSGTFGTGNFTTTSFTPPSNSLLVVGETYIENNGTTTDPTSALTISGGGWTYTGRVSAVASPTSFPTVTKIWTAPVTTGASMTLTLGAGGRNASMYAVSVVAYTGYNTSTPTGGIASGSQSGGFTGPPDPVTILLNTGPAPGSEVFGLVGIDKNVAGTTPGINWTEINDLENTDSGGLESEFLTGWATTSVTWADIRAGGGALFNYAAVGLEIRAGAAVVSAPTVAPLLVSTPWASTVPKVYLSASQPLGNPAVPTAGPLVVGPEFASAPIPGALLFGPGAPAVVVSSAATPGPLVVSPAAAAAPIPRAQIFGPNPTATTPGALVVTPTFVPVPVPPVSVTASQPLGNPATGSPGPLVVSVPYTRVPVPGALLTSNPAAAPLVAGTTAQPLVVSTPWLPLPVPGASLTASQPLGNPATPTPAVLVVGVAYVPVPVPGAHLSANPPPAIVSTTSTASPLVVGPPNTPVPVPPVSITWSAPLGNPAVGTPGPLVVGPASTPVPIPRAFLAAGSSTTSSALPLVVVPAFTLAPVPGARVFAAPQAPAVVSTVGTPGPLVVSPPFVAVPIPQSLFSANRPLGNPAVGSPKPLVVGPVFRWPVLTVPVLSAGIRDVASSCTTPRPSSGTTPRPSSGSTAYSLASTARPSTGVTARPDTGTTEDEC